MDVMTASPSSIKADRCHYSGVCHGTLGELFQGHTSTGTRLR